MYCNLIEAFNSPLEHQVNTIGQHGYSRFAAYNTQNNIEQFDDISDDLSYSTLMTDDQISLNSMSDNIPNNITKPANHPSAIRSHEMCLRAIVADINDQPIADDIDTADCYHHLRFCTYCKDELRTRLRGRGVECRNNPVQYPALSINTTEKKIIVISVMLGLLIIMLLEISTRRTGLFR